MEFRTRQTLFNIARGVGVQLKIDPISLYLGHGMFVRVLIDIDLDYFKMERILVTMEDQCFFIKIEYEKLLIYYSSCKSIGHSMEDYRRQEDKRAPDVAVRTWNKEGTQASQNTAVNKRRKEIDKVARHSTVEGGKQLESLEAVK